MLFVRGTIWALLFHLQIFIREMCTQSNEAYNAVKKRETDADYEAVDEQYPLPPSTPSLTLHTTATATVDTLYEKI